MKKFVLLLLVVMFVLLSGCATGKSKFPVNQRLDCCPYQAR